MAMIGELCEARVPSSNAWRSFDLHNVLMFVLKHLRKHLLSIFECTPTRQMQWCSARCHFPLFPDGVSTGQNTYALSSITCFRESSHLPNQQASEKVPQHGLFKAIRPQRRVAWIATFASCFYSIMIYLCNSFYNVDLFDNSLRKASSHAHSCSL